MNIFSHFGKKISHNLLKILDFLSYYLVSMKNVKTKHGPGFLILRHLLCPKDIRQSAGGVVRLYLGI